MSTIGVDIDPDGYSPNVDGLAVQPVPVNGSLTISHLTIGTHLVRLEGVALNCFTDGTNERSVDVTSGSTVSVSFTISCVRSQRLAFVDGIFSNLYVVNSDGTGASQITANQSYSDPTWSPDGNRLAFAHYSEGYQGVYVMDANGSGITRLTDGRSFNHSPAWSPDGTRITFVSERDGNAEIYVMNTDGMNPVRLTRDVARDADPAWSPDGSKIAFSRNSRIYAMNSDGSAVTRLTLDEVNDNQPAWSPDGTTIAFSRQTAPGDSYAIFTMQADGSDAKRLTQDFIFAGDPAWSKDGRVAFETITECHPVPWCFDECTGKIMILNPDRTLFGLMTIDRIDLALDPAWRP